VAFRLRDAASCHQHSSSESPVVPNDHHPSIPAMNRQKKLQQLFKAKAKKASAKLAPAKKNTYISKADRLKLAAEATPETVTSTEG
jgi:hypothetical protein